MTQKNVKTVLVDDEPNAIRLMDEILTGLHEITVVERFTDPVKALLYLKNTPTDLVFLDIQMPMLNGLDLVRSLRASNIDLYVVFITAFNQHAIEAFHQEAFDYLMKPVSPMEVKDTVERLLKRLTVEENRKKLDQLLTRMAVSRIRIPDRNGITFYDPQEIIYVEADGNYSKLVMKSSQTLVTRQIGALEELLSDHGFVRSNRSFLINTRYLTRIDRKQHTCLLSWEQQSIDLPVSEERIRIWT